MKKDRIDAANRDDELLNLRKSLQAAEQRRLEITAELDQLGYAISHDLRAPLRAIDGFSAILLEDYAEKLDDQGRHSLQVVRDNCRKMSRYIDALLELARVGRHETNPIKIDMNELCKTICTGLGATNPDRTIRFQVENLPAAQADRDMIREVITELLDNAVKSTSTRAVAEIRISGETDGNEQRYAINDNGIGFDAEQAGRLFGLFQKLHRTTEFAGEGAGLAKVRRILDRNGGRVWAEGAADAGATFFFTLPAPDPMRSSPGTKEGTP